MNQRAIKLCSIFLITLLMVACGGSEAPEEVNPVAPAPEPAGEIPEPAPEPAPAPAPEPEPAAPSNPLLDPDSPDLNRRAPDQYRARFRTSQGDFVLEVHRDWAPLGADRFYNLVSAGFFDDTRFFRVMDGFIVQFGIHGDPDVSAAWSWAEIQDDAVLEGNTPGRITFAIAGPNTRTTQVFINLGNNSNLDSMGFAPFGEVVEGMDVVQQIYGGYGDGPPRGRGPNQGLLEDEGNAYLDREYPQLDSIIRAAIQ